MNGRCEKKRKLRRVKNIFFPLILKSGVIFEKKQNFLNKK